MLVNPDRTHPFVVEILHGRGEMLVCCGRVWLTIREKLISRCGFRALTFPYLLFRFPRRDAGGDFQYDFERFVAVARAPILLTLVSDFRDFIAVALAGVPDRRARALSWGVLIAGIAVVHLACRLPADVPGLLPRVRAPCHGAACAPSFRSDGNRGILGAGCNQINVDRRRSGAVREPSADSSVGRSTHSLADGG